MTTSILSPENMPPKKVLKADAQIGCKQIGSIVDETALKRTCYSQQLSAGLALNEEPKEQKKNGNGSEDELVDAAKEGDKWEKATKVGGMVRRWVVEVKKSVEKSVEIKVCIFVWFIMNLRPGCRKTNADKDAEVAVEEAKPSKPNKLCKLIISF